MKNLPQRGRAARRARSAYSRRGKTPYRYPAWCAATSNGGHTPADIAREAEMARLANRAAANIPAGRGRGFVRLIPVRN